ncbi:MAG: hypothetical protein KGK07_13570, partial [Chloroflexota bacterium]|nr:hypothetical protein [Chloroflexota bacterium]
VDAGEVLQMDAGDAAIARPDVATNDVLEHDAGDVDASSSTDAGAGGDVLELDAGAVDARACVVITGYTCAVSGYPYPARCDSLPCCCATP